MTTSSATVSDLVAEFGDWLAELAPAPSQEESIERINRFEELKGQLDAAQAREAANFEKQRLAQEAQQKVPKADRGKGLGAEIGLARRESSARGTRFLNLSRALDQDMPYTLEALAAGRIREHHAEAMVKATEVLTSEHRQGVDRAMKNRLGVAGPKELANEARAHAQSLDPQAAAARHRQATKARRVTCQPVADGMAQLVAYGPAHVLEGMANNLRARAKTLINAGKSQDSQGNRRTRDQLMFDLFADLPTGASQTAGKSVDLVLMMTPETLLADGDTPAWLAGHGPIPAEVAREWLADEKLKVFLRRLFTDPTGTRLVSMEAKGRAFSFSLRKMLLLRDNTCRNPHCEALIADGDHIQPLRAGGKTSWKNASGLCAACNQTKENRGWKHKGDDQHLSVTTPTGHTYTTTPSPLIPGFQSEAHEAINPKPPDGKPRTNRTRPRPEAYRRTFDRYRAVAKIKTPPRTRYRDGAGMTVP